MYFLSDQTDFFCGEAGIIEALSTIEALTILLSYPYL
jgi:hypothetical protein